MVLVVEAVARRSAYLVLLTENPDALRRLLTLCAASPWIAEQITRFPLLLDELLNERRLFKPPLAPELAAELRERLTRLRHTPAICPRAMAASGRTSRCSGWAAQLWLAFRVA